MKSVRYYSLLSLLFFFNINLDAQEPETTELKETYESHFRHYRESVHLHVNKTTFIQGDEIWWTAYAYNKKSNQRSNPTKNLYCGLYDSNGDQITEDLFLFEKGVAHGSFKIDSTWNSGTYYLKAGTKWMNNFKEDVPFVKQINIIKPSAQTDSPEPQEGYDLQLLPEGGHLIADTDNMVGLRIIDWNGRGVRIQKGGVFDSENNQLTEVFTNEAGLGRFELLPKQQQTYTLKATLKNGSTIEKMLPEAKNNGIAMAVNNILEEKLVVSLNTNNRTFETIKKDSFHLAIHRDGIMTLNSFVFDSISRNIKVNKENLLPGTNIITLFNKNLEPISERLIFNFKGLNLAKASVIKGKEKKDSVSLKIKAYINKNKPVSLSVSALPSSNTHDLKEFNIFSSFLLHPYLKSPIENSSRYFSDSDRIKEYELDLAMLTQGWSSYDWGLIFNGEPEITYPFEHGVSAKLKLNSELKKEERLALIGDGIGSMVLLDLDDSQTLELTDLFSKNGDTLNFSIRKKRGGLKKPDLEVKFPSIIERNDSMDLTKHLLPEGLFLNPFSNEPLADIPFKLSSDIIELDEVVLTEEKKETKLVRKSALINDSFTGVKIGEKEIKHNLFLLDFIAKNGFLVDFVVQTGQVAIRNSKPGFQGGRAIPTPTTDNPAEANGTGLLATSSSAGAGVRVYEDDFLVNDLRQLLNVPMSEIDEIYFERNGAAGDTFNSQNGVIRIYRKVGPRSRSNSIYFAEKLVENSFSRPKTFYRPKYISTRGDAFENYGIVHWEPQLITNKKGEVEFKIPKDNISSVKVLIEGMGEDGSLLSHTQEILLNGSTQDINNYKLQDGYESHFSDLRESLHLHLNKDVFFVGEEIWWTAYFYDKKAGEPSRKTTNLHCAIYNADGNRVSSGMFLVENGITNGSFKLDNSFKSGTYYIKAGTSWMQNFREEQDFLKEITVINETITESEPSPARPYNLQILPEGGHIIKGAENTIGIKLVDNDGMGMEITEGKVMAPNSEKVADVVTNSYGVGKFILRGNVEYPLTLEAILPNGETINKKLPEPKRKGIVINVNNILEDKIVISLKTNPSTLKEISGKNFHMAVHRDGLMALKTFKIDELKKVIKIGKSKLLSGTNIITLFDDDLNPISERLVFNYQNLKLGKLKVEVPQRKNKDSVSVLINAFSKNNTPVSLSVSALPSETTSKNTHSSIVSNFLLTPYLRSEVEHAARYFEDIDRTKAYELDLILLTQGWSSYDWRGIFDGPPKIEHPFENGISVSGKLNSKIRKGDQLVIQQGNMFNMQFVELKDSTNFQIDNFLQFNGDTLMLSLRNRNKKLRKPEMETTFLSTKVLGDSIAQESLGKKIPFGISKEINNQNGNTTDKPLFKQDNTIFLEGVTVSEERIEKKLTRASPLINGLFDGFKISDDDVKRNPLLSDFIRRQGFRVQEDFANNVLLIGSPIPLAGPVAVYDNDILVRDFTQLANIPLYQIDEIYLTKDGLFEGPDFGGGTIRIYRKTGGYSPTTLSFAEKLVENSFTRPKKFYRPQYDYSNENFLSSGIVHWEPNLVTNKKGEATLTLPDDGVTNVTLFFEGMADDGTLISHSEKISLE
ncbi:hypothetical protein ACOKFD_09470 [Flagellimonas sp. S174]|uniref:hypothetical protein n=1 Tax=Flagellimonas sp. S174 TaxID=3410790 RepID=UPI003BF573CD